MRPLLFLLLISSTIAGEPWKRHTIDSSSKGADGVRLLDVNGDGFLDVATGWEEGGVVRAYLHPGAEEVKQPWPSVTVGRVKSCEDAVFADIDGDGATDVVSCCEGKTRSVFIHWAPKDKSKWLDEKSWSTSAIPAVEKKQMWMFALPMQIDGENGVDIVIASKGSGSSVGWLQAPKNPRDLSGWKFRSLYDAGWIMSLQAIDMDGDGDQDVLLSDRKGSNRGIKWLENPGAEEAEGPWKVKKIGGEDAEVMFLNAGDIDGDKKRDTFCAVKGKGILRFESGKRQEIAMPPNCGSGKGVAIGDIDLDGKMDLAFSCEHATSGKSGVRWIRYDKSPDETTWKDFEISGPEGVKFDRIELLDIDGDGDLDLMTCEERDLLGVIWYENPTK